MAVGGVFGALGYGVYKLITSDSFKDDVKEVQKGYECGVGIEGYNDMREGDYIESYKEKEEVAVL